MARLGLQTRFKVTFANDFDARKADAYGANHGGDVFRLGDVATLDPADLPGHASLAWASFPCQDLSLAGARGGLDAPRSGAFWSFWRLMRELGREGRAPRTIVLENVRGLLTSRRGQDFHALVRVLADAGYRVGAVEIDAASFVPQSRPRVFVIAALHAPAELCQLEAASHAIAHACAGLDAAARSAWVNWRLPPPPVRNTRLDDVLDGALPACEALGAQLFEIMAPRQRGLVSVLTERREQSAGAAFRRVRIEDGARVVRAEARFDGLAGCLRTPAGGSSRQFLLFAGGGKVSARLMSPREAARLMGLPDDYRLPSSTTQALHLVGDGVCVPVVRWLTDHLLAPLAAQTAPRARVA